MKLSEIFKMLYFSVDSHTVKLSYFYFLAVDLDLYAIKEKSISKY